MNYTFITYQSIYKYKKNGFNKERKRYILNDHGQKIFILHESYCLFTPHKPHKTAHKINILCSKEYNILVCVLFFPLPLLYIAAHTFIYIYASFHYVNNMHKYSNNSNTEHSNIRCLSLTISYV